MFQRVYPWRSIDALQLRSAVLPLSPPLLVTVMVALAVAVMVAMVVVMVIAVRLAVVVLRCYDPDLSPSGTIPQYAEGHYGDEEEEEEYAGDDDDSQVIRRRYAEPVIRCTQIIGGGVG